MYYFLRLCSSRRVTIARRGRLFVRDSRILYRKIVLYPMSSAYLQIVHFICVLFLLVFLADAGLTNPKQKASPKSKPTGTAKALKIVKGDILSTILAKSPPNYPPNTPKAEGRPPPWRNPRYAKQAKQKAKTKPPWYCVQSWKLEALFVCLFVCLFVSLFACLLVCLFSID